MSNFSGDWIGNVNGTNVGNASLEIEDVNGQISGSLHFNDGNTGEFIAYDLDGEKDNLNNFEFRLIPKKLPNGVETAPGSGNLALESNGNLTGRWSTEDGGKGVFGFSRPYNRQERERSSAQVFSHAASIGAVRLYHEDLKKIVQRIQEGFTAPLVVTYLQHGSEVTRFADDFLKEEIKPPIKLLTIAVQQLEADNIMRTVNVNFFPNTGSQIRASSSDGLWAAGIVASLRNMISNYESRSVSWYRKHGMLLSSLVLCIMVVLVPEFTDWIKRAAFVALALVIFGSLTVLYNKALPNTLYTSVSATPSGWHRAWNGFLLLLISQIVGIVLELFVFRLLME
ncbi:MAG: hypothetical protein MPK06_01955 [Alphaproteobacteria bacterium]|nr:hypothetical protein [Alphaproteobacteria bacterium]MDA8003590.1 hypothetical protein [Alphaproteobacteria bacterium]MDA8005293.1 hypothetical protein [Alphaproteobacteria bacterium]MDA8012849.1 hypothetical protein [Alphaproteobacteria bacterium]